MVNIKHEIVLEDFLSSYFVLSFIFGCVLTKVPIINLFLLPYYIFGNSLVSFVGAVFYCLFKSYMTTHFNLLDAEKNYNVDDAIVNNTVNVCVTFNGANLSYCNLYSFDKSQYETVPDYYIDLHKFLSVQDMQKSLIKLVTFMIKMIIYYGQLAFNFVKEKTHTLHLE